MKSKALEVNLECTRVDVSISERYEALREIVAEYGGLRERLDELLREVCHPYRNWALIIKESHSFAFDSFHVFQRHAKGPEGVRLFVDIWVEGVLEAGDPAVKAEAADSLLAYLRKVVKDSGKDLERFFQVLEDAANRMACLEEDYFSYFCRSYYEIPGLARMLLEQIGGDTGFLEFNRLVFRHLQYSFDYWLGRDDPLEWFTTQVEVEGPSEILKIFEPVSHKTLKGHERHVRGLAQEDPDSRDLLERFVRIPAFRDVMKTYRDIPRALARSSGNAGDGKIRQLVFLFRIMDLDALAPFHEETLREVNRTLSGLLVEQKPEEAEPIIRKTFSLLRETMERFPFAALSLLRNMGRSVFEKGGKRLVSLFVDQTAAAPFYGPGKVRVDHQGLSEANPAHVQNIRTWLELIGMRPGATKKLLSCLVINLAIKGVYLRDTDLFPRDISAFLGRDISGQYNLVKQLMRLFPSYFSEIGAEGRLRDVSTEIDELTGREDSLVHFLRKQAHVESSNRIVDLVESFLGFWRTGEIEPLRDYLPERLYGQLEQGEFFPEAIHGFLKKVFEEKGFTSTRDLLTLEEGDIKETAAALPDLSKTDQRRVVLALELYRLLHNKYTVQGNLFELEPIPLEKEVPALSGLKETLEHADSGEKIRKLTRVIGELKTIILSDTKYEPLEDIYHKRHFAADIPSMYGLYHEPRFDAMGLTFRLESMLGSLLENMVVETDLTVITGAAMSRIHKDLALLYGVLELDGIHCDELERNLDLLSRALGVRGFSFSQFRDVFLGLSNAVQNIVNDFFVNVHQDNLYDIVQALRPDELLPKYRSRDQRQEPVEATADRVFEIFVRERIAASPGLQALDRYLKGVLENLERESRRLPVEELGTLMNYDSEKAVTSLDSAGEDVRDLIYLGNKALNLVRLSSLGFPVPPGFVVTTEVYRIRELLSSYAPVARGLDSKIDEQLERLQEKTGLKFGDLANPLLLSVRSGAAVSQPGMMDTVLNAGINEDIAMGMASSINPWFAWDCFRRFLQSYGMTFGIPRDLFDDVMNEHKARAGVLHKSQLSPSQMEALARSYLEFLKGRGVDVVLEPRAQLGILIQKIFDSWLSPKAVAYRRILGLSDDWGTAVTVQQMVYGNASRVSGSGVVFTHSPRWPSTGIRPWGDYSPGDQGEDVVSGLVETCPITVKQAELEGRQGRMPLEQAFPEVFEALVHWMEELLGQDHWGPQEMEFTFAGERGEDLYILQTRDMGRRRRDGVPAFADPQKARDRFIGRGIGAGGGAMTGRAVYNLGEIQEWREKEPETSLILIRGDTVPDDIREIHAADGILTARGGTTSHAAIVAQRLGKTSVVGMGELLCDEKSSSCSIGASFIKSGDFLSMDGRDGTVYFGEMEIL